MNILRIALILLALPVSSIAQPPIQWNAHQALVKAKTAHSAADFQELSVFYRHQAEVFAKMAQEQHETYVSARRQWTSKSYPQAADRARLLADYYTERSTKSRQLADTFADKAAESLRQQAQPASADRNTLK